MECNLITNQIDEHIYVDLVKVITNWHLLLLFSAQRIKELGEILVGLEMGNMYPSGMICLTATVCCSELAP